MGYAGFISGGARGAFSALGIGWCGGLYICVIVNAPLKF